MIYHWLIFAVFCTSQQILDTEVYVSKSLSGNPLEVVLATHPLAYSLTNTVKEVVIEAAFVQEIHAVEIVNKYSPYYKILREKKAE